MLDGVCCSLPLPVRFVEGSVVGETKDVGREERGEATGEHAVLAAVSDDAAK